MINRGRLLALGGLLAGLGGCATLQPCSAVGVAQLQCEASRGLKPSQLELAKAYESGIGVPVDYERAARLYRAAASSVSGTTYVYSPPVGKSAGRVIPIRTGPDQAGSAEAKVRLARLYETGRGVKQDVEKARKLISEAAESGYTEPLP